MADTVKFGDGIDWSAEARRVAAENNSPSVQPGEMALEIRKALNPDDCLVQWGIGLRIVDCGCNIGTFCPQFAAVGFAYTGLDQSADALAIARQKWSMGRFVQTFLWENWLDALAEMEIEEGTSYRLDAARGRNLFHVAFCNAVLQHNTHPEKRRILPQIARALRPGGLFAMQESTVREQTATQLRQDEWIALVEEHGFKLLSTWHKNEFGLEDGYLFTRLG